MQVSRWGNSLAVRLPATVVDALGLREGDEIEIEVADRRRFRVARDARRDKALETPSRLGWALPKGFRLHRAWPDALRALTAIRALGATPHPITLTAHESALRLRPVVVTSCTTP
jgi:antitoxin MazE